MPWAVDETSVETRMRRTPRLLFASIVFCTLWISGCGGGSVLEPPALPNESPFTGDPSAYRLLVRFAQISDSQVIDEESPGRLAGFDDFVSPAWRPQEAYSTQLLDGIVRAINRQHQRTPIDFVIHTGDAIDNAQTNELAWFLGIMDGAAIDPRSGPDDRDASGVPPPPLDPHHSFQAEGLYRETVHGPLPSIPWYAVYGNHDVLGVGVFPIVEWNDGVRISPLPLVLRPGLVFPTLLVPAGSVTYALITPALPGPPRLLDGPRRVVSNPERAFSSRGEYLAALFATISGPPGHGFESPQGPTWYARTVAPGVLLIGLDTTDVPNPQPGLPYPDGSIGPQQRRWLEDTLKQAASDGQWVIVASHHPSWTLRPEYGSALLADDFRELLNGYENVVLHLAGHKHRNRVFNRGGYLEIETASTLDYPQTGRLVELRFRRETGEMMISYSTFTHRGGDDALAELRETAYQLAVKDAGKAAARSAARVDRFDPADIGSDETNEAVWLAGSPSDQSGTAILQKPAENSPTE